MKGPMNIDFLKKDAPVNKAFNCQFLCEYFALFTEWLLYIHKKEIKRRTGRGVTHLSSNILYSPKHIAQSAGPVKYTDCFSVEGKINPTPTSVLHMILNNQRVRFQSCWSFGECGVPLNCHCSRVLSMGQIEINC